MTSGHVSISPPSVPFHQATIRLAWSKYVQCPMAASPHAFSSHLRFPPGFLFCFLFFVFCFLGFIYLFIFHFSGGESGRQGLNPRCVLCDASDGACCNMLTVAHCTPSHPPPSCFWTPSIVRWLPTASVPHVCHWLDYSMKELEWTLTLNMSCSPNQHTVLPVEKSKLVVLQHLHVDFYDHSILFLAVEGHWLFLFWQ